MSGAHEDAQPRPAASSRISLSCTACPFEWAAARCLLTELDGKERDKERRNIGHHMCGIGQQRETVEHDAADDFIDPQDGLDLRIGENSVDRGHCVERGNAIPGSQFRPQRRNLEFWSR